MIRYVIFILIVVFIGQYSQGQSLDSLIADILETEPGIRAARLNYEADLAEVDQTGYLPEPEVGVGFFVSPVETRVGPQQFRAGATQMFPWAGTLKTQRDVALTDARMGREQLRSRQLDMIYQGKLAWYELFEIDALIEMEQENIKMYDALESFSLGKVESGEGSLADVLRVQIQREASRQRIRELENHKLAPLATINALLNRQPGAQFSPEGELRAPFIEGLINSIDSILPSHPGIQTLMLKQEKASQELRLNDLERKPGFGVGLDYIVVGEREVADLDDNGRDIIMPRLMARIPLFQKKYDAVRQEQELRIAAVDNNIQATLRSMQSRVTSALMQYWDAELKLIFYEDQREKTRAAVDILESNYSSEGKGFEELLRLRIDLTNYDIKSLQAKISQHRALAQIEHLLTSQIKDYE